VAQVSIHGKMYSPVIDRVNDLHDNNKGNLSITTELVSLVEGVCIMRATIVTEKGTYTGFALEKEGSTTINKTSFLENCETSAIGRACAAAGYGGSEYASSNEVQNAIHQQQNDITDGVPVNVPTKSSPKPIATGAPQVQGVPVG
tara:strand:- start:2263 stop:2697 length:435 start_codon:yes stop_codon:yes gene_type:complete